MTRDKYLGKLFTVYIYRGDGLIQSVYMNRMEKHRVVTAFFQKDDFEEFVNSYMQNTEEPTYTYEPNRTGAISFLVQDYPKAYAAMLLMNS